MNEYRIEKLRRAVTVAFRGGRRLEGDVFVRLQARHHDGPEEPSDHLNDETSFFALLLSAGEVVLVAKEQVAWVEFPLGDADTRFEVPHVGISVEVLLADGACTTGTVFPEARADRARLLDFLNENSPHFLPVFDAETTRLINRRMIVYVKQLS
jgi:hypothetical protein